MPLPREKPASLGGPADDGVEYAYGTPVPLTNPARSGTTDPEKAASLAPAAVKPAATDGATSPGTDASGRPVDATATAALPDGTRVSVPLDPDAPLDPVAQ